MQKTPLVLCLSIVCSFHSLSAQQPEAAEVQALRLTPDQAETVRLDGVLGEEFWQQAQVIRDFLQQEPAEGSAATENTEVRIAVDHENLYVAVMAFDREPDRIVSQIGRAHV